MPQGKYFTIKSQSNGKVLDVRGSGADAGTDVVAFDPHGGDNQLWCEDYAKGCIRPKLNEDLCIQVEGNHLILGEFEEGNADQRWKVGDKRIENVDNSGMVLDIAASEEEGSRVCQWEFHGGVNQLWDVDYEEAAFFLLRSKKDGKVLDIRASSTSEGAEVIVYDEAGTDNQLWYEDLHGCIKSKLSDMVLDASHEDGYVRMQLFDCHNEKQGFTCRGDKACNMHSCQVLDVSAKSDGGSSKVCQYTFHGGDNQLWERVYL